jgi:hypothetical protein
MQPLLKGWGIWSLSNRLLPTTNYGIPETSTGELRVVIVPSPS